MLIQVAISVGKVEPTLYLAKQTNLRSQGSPHDHFYALLTSNHIQYTFCDFELSFVNNCIFELSFTVT